MVIRCVKDAEIDLDLDYAHRGLGVPIRLPDQETFYVYFGVGGGKYPADFQVMDILRGVLQELPDNCTYQQIKGINPREYNNPTQLVVPPVTKESTASAIIKFREALAKLREENLAGTNEALAHICAKLLPEMHKAMKEDFVFEEAPSRSNTAASMHAEFLEGFLKGWLEEHYSIPSNRPSGPVWTTESLPIGPAKY